MRLVKASDIEPRPINWLWYQKIPMGHTTIIEGDPSTSKSTLVITMASHVSRGLPWPDGSPCPKGEVIILNAEDLRDEVIRARLHAAEADTDKVTILSRDDTKPDEPPFSIPEDVLRLEQAISKSGVKLVTIDPLDGFLSGSVDAYRSTQIRKALLTLEAMAQRLCCAVIMVRHLRKPSGDGKSKAIYQGLGSIGIIGAARAGFLVQRDPADKSRRIMTAVKANWGPDVGGVAYKVEPFSFTNSLGEKIDTVRTVWDGTVDITADQLANIDFESTAQGSLADAQHFLEVELEDGELHSSSELYTKAAQAGISKGKLWEANHLMGLIMLKMGFGEAPWGWKLRPAPGSELDIVSHWAGSGVFDEEMA